MPSAELARLLQQLQDPSPYLRRQAAQDVVPLAAGASGADQQAMLVALSGVLADSNKYVRLSGAAALAQIAGDVQPAADTLRALLTDPHRDVRLATLQTLSRLGSLAEPLLPEFQQLAAQDPHPAVRQTATDLCQQLGG